jgi:hypothetical protein
MGTYSVVLKNQNICINCAKNFGKELIKNININFDIKKCTMCGQKKETYHSKYYENIKV